MHFSMGVCTCVLLLHSLCVRAQVELYADPARQTVMHVKSYTRDGIRYADVRAADRTTNIFYCVITGIRFDPLPDANNNNNNALHT